MAKYSNDRKSPRLSTKLWAVIVSGKTEVGCHVSNISEHGAYLLVPPQFKHEKGTLIFQLPNEPVKKLGFSVKRAENWQPASEKSKSYTKAIGVEFSRALLPKVVQRIAEGSSANLQLI